MIVLCAVCFRGGDALARESLNMGIAVLLGVTAVVLACFTLFFVTLARRSRAAARMQSGLENPVPMDDLHVRPLFKPGFQ